MKYCYLKSRTQLRMCGQFGVIKLHDNLMTTATMTIDNDNNDDDDDDDKKRENYNVQFMKLFA